MTQAELSLKIGLSRASVANIEAGRQAVLLHQFVMLANAMSMMPAELLPPHPPAQPRTDLPESVQKFMHNLDSKVQKSSRVVR